MRVENITNHQAPRSEGAGPIKGLPAGLQEGDSFSAKVLHSENGNVHLKTADGQVFKARLEGSAIPAEGRNVELMVSDVREGTVVLLLGEGGHGGQAAQKNGLYANRELAPYARQLESMGLPVSNQTAGLMRHILQQNPALPPEKAAFLAAAGISEEPALRQAALQLLEGGGKIGDLLQELSRLVDWAAAPRETAAPQEMAAPRLAAPQTPAAPQIAAPQSPAPQETATPQTVTPPQAAPQTVTPQALTAQTPAQTLEIPPQTSPQPAAATPPQNYSPPAQSPEQGPVTQPPAQQTVTPQTPTAQTPAPQPSAPQAPAPQAAASPSGWVALVDSMLGGLPPPPPEVRQAAQTPAQNAPPATQSQTAAQSPPPSIEAPQTPQASAPQASASQGQTPPQAPVQAPPSQPITLPAGEILRADGSGAPQMPAPQTPPAQTPQAPPPQTPTQQALQTPAPQIPAQTPQTPAAPPISPRSPTPQTPQAPQAAPAPQNPDGAIPELAVRLAAMPGLSSLSESKTAAFAQMLEGLTRQMDAILAREPEGQTEGIKDFIDSIFAKIDDDRQNAPAILRKAQSELSVKLALLREAVYRMESGPSSEPAAQAQKLVDHMRMLSQIDQFAYVQLPIMQNGQQKTAELYVYRDKKGGKKIDPENARILLSLELESMGRLEAFVAIRLKEVALRLDVERPECAGFFRARTPDLYVSLRESGYKLTENKVRVAEKKTTVEGAMQALIEFGSKPGGIDIRL